MYALRLVERVCRLRNDPPLAVESGFGGSSGDRASRLDGAAPTRGVSGMSILDAGFLEVLWAGSE